MSEPRSAPRVAGGFAAGSAGAGYRAVQQDVAVTVVDWLAVHAWSEGDRDFVGAVTVMDGACAQLVTVDWPAPTDRSADLRWVGRVAPWQRDWLGRRVAPVARVRPCVRRPGYGGRR